MNDSAKKIRKTVIPVTWVATIIIALGYFIYALISIDQWPQQMRGTAETLSISFIGYLWKAAIIVFSGYMLTVIWEILADWIDNMAIIANNTTPMMDRRNKSSYGEDHNIESLKRKRAELIKQFKRDDLSYSEKTAVYEELMKIDSELKKSQSNE